MAPRQVVPYAITREDGQFSRAGQRCGGARTRRTMESQYGRGLGWTCANCHVPGKWDDDAKKNKRIARQMQAMQDYVNGRALGRIKELDEEYDKATCTMCHRGSNEPKGTLDDVPRR